jgi:hypothetical protein
LYYDTSGSFIDNSKVRLQIVTPHTIVICLVIRLQTYFTSYLGPSLAGFGSEAGGDENFESAARNDGKSSVSSTGADFEATKFGALDGLFDGV